MRGSIKLAPGAEPCMPPAWQQPGPNAAAVGIAIDHHSLSDMTLEEEPSATSQCLSPAEAEGLAAGSTSRYLLLQQAASKHNVPLSQLMRVQADIRNTNNPVVWVMMEALNISKSIGVEGVGAEATLIFHLRNPAEAAAALMSMGVID